MSSTFGGLPDGPARYEEPDMPSSARASRASAMALALALMPASAAGTITITKRTSLSRKQGLAGARA